MASQRQKQHNLSHSLSPPKPSSARWPVYAVAVTLVMLACAAIYLHVPLYEPENSSHTVESHQQGTKKSIRGEAAAAIRGPAKKESESGSIVTKPSTNGSRDTVALKTQHGDIRIAFRPDLSSESVQYIKDAVTAGCNSCQLYRAEKPGILQGIFSTNAVDINKVFGKCPSDGTKPQDCPKHDPNCGCHGPVMTRGMVGWAGGQAGGPDFFMNTYAENDWGNQHTIWGEIKDAESFAVVDKIYELPIVEQGGMRMLKERINFMPELSH